MQWQWKAPPWHSLASNPAVQQVHSLLITSVAAKVNNIQHAAPLCQCHTHSDLTAEPDAYMGRQAIWNADFRHLPQQKGLTLAADSKQQGIRLRAYDSVSPWAFVGKRAGSNFGWDPGRHHTLKRALTPSSWTVLLKQSVMPLYMMALPDSACRFCAPAQPDICTTGLCRATIVVCFKLHFILYILHFIFYILHFSFYILYFMFDIVYFTLCIVYCIFVYFILYIVYCVLCIVYCILYIVYCILYIVYCILYIVYCILFCLRWMFCAYSGEESLESGQGCQDALQNHFGLLRQQLAVICSHNHLHSWSKQTSWCSTTNSTTAPRRWKRLCPFSVEIQCKVLLQ